ncbi:MAG: hypothetical protein ACO1OX_14745 [Novosphingobium sp.]
MSDPRATYRYAALLLGASVLVVGTLIVTGISSTGSSPSADAASAADPGQSNQSAFAAWAEADDTADEKGRLIGEIERNGKMVELRQLPEGVEPERIDQDLPADESAPDRSQP